MAQRFSWFHKKTARDYIVLYILINLCYTDIFPPVHMIFILLNSKFLSTSQLALALKC